ncbi:DUF6368 family protein [Streptomyces hiroshimensis]|uniref:Uncharacterized protein n=1 Tax=Streptomyces hiroshimensis TaxID=66424 RepID=A0ABQ2YZJ9_9ACTN|nr:DUF6368 family protein [Streptomyces hiroshimensis]GGY00514.1 hypothetical protein GCM10010324_54030 [Streptomyces hiroshimensis]
MSGPVVVIELAGTAPGVLVERLREEVLALSDGCEEERPGEFGIGVPVERLGIPGPRSGAGGEGVRPFVVSLMGPGVGDEDLFEAEHAREPGEPGPASLIGFTPTHAVDVVALCGSPVDHLAAALLTARLMDAIGGVASAELRQDQVPDVAGLPGIVARANGPYPAVFGTAEFLRAWAGRPGFRLVA